MILALVLIDAWGRIRMVRVFCKALVEALWVEHGRDGRASGG